MKFIRIYNFIRKNKTEIYTAIFGEYDYLKEPPQIDNVDFICFTDKKNLRSEKYKIIRKKPLLKDPARNARMYKVLPHIFLHNYQYTIWIDASFQIKEGITLDELLRHVGNNNIAIFKHPERECIYEEINACKYYKRDDFDIMEKQINYYHEQHYPKNNGLVACGFIIRKNLTKDVIKLNEEWWSQITQFSKRDQLSFNYVCWKNNINYTVIEGLIWDNKFIKFIGHKKHLKFKYEVELL